MPYDLNNTLIEDETESLSQRIKTTMSDVNNLINDRDILDMENTRLKRRVDFLTEELEIARSGRTSPAKVAMPHIKEGNRFEEQTQKATSKVEGGNIRSTVDLRNSQQTKEQVQAANTAVSEDLRAKEVVREQVQVDVNKKIVNQEQARTKMNASSDPTNQLTASATVPEGRVVQQGTSVKVIPATPDDPKIIEEFTHKNKAYFKKMSSGESKKLMHFVDSGTGPKFTKQSEYEIAKSEFQNSVVETSNGREIERTETVEL